MTVIATEGNKFPDGRICGNRKRAVWIWPLLVVSDVFFLGLVAFLLMAKPLPAPVETMVRFIDLHFAWIAFCIGAFIGIALFLALSKSKQPAEELIGLAREMGWTLERKWGFAAGWGAVSLFGYGPYFRVRHKGLALTFSPMVDEEGRELGLRVSASHEQSLGLGLMLKAGVSFSMDGRMPGEYKAILSKRLDIALPDIRAWAGDRERAIEIFSDREILNRLDGLKRELDVLNEQAESRLLSISSGYVISDRRISLLLSRNHHLNKDLVDAICDLSLALTGAHVAPAISVSRNGDRVYRTVLVTLISLVLASLVWVLTDYIRDLL